MICERMKRIRQMNILKRYVIRHFYIYRRKVPNAPYSSKAKLIGNFLRIVPRNADNTNIRAVLLYKLNKPLIVHYLNIVYGNSYQSRIDFKYTFYIKSRLGIYVIYNRLSEITGSHNHHFVLLIKTEYGAYLIIKPFNIISVSLLSKATEVVEILSYLRCCIADKTRKLI